MREFKVGDKVICIHGGSGVAQGAKYIVHKITYPANPRDHSEENRYWVIPKGKDNGVWQWRFKLICGELPKNIRVL